MRTDAPLVKHLWLAVDHSALYFGGTAHGVDDASKFRQQSITGALNDTAPVFPNLWIDELFKMHLEVLVRAFLVRAHKARIAHRISGEDRGQSADQRHRSSGPSPPKAYPGPLI